MANGERPSAPSEQRQQNQGWEAYGCSWPGKTELREYIGLMFSAMTQGLSRRIPSACAVCHAWPAQPICEDCIQVFAQPVHRCISCALALPATLTQCRSCASLHPEWDRALAAVDYAFPWDRLIAEFKFHENPAWARHFAVLIRSSPWVEPALEDADFIVPMPLATERLLQRGFNQSTLLARHLNPAKVLEGALLRVVNTPAQSTLARKDRQSNLRRAFAMEPARPGIVAGKRLVLLDDVMTSGASMAAASAVLKRAGASHITALVFARTGVDTVLA